VRKNTNYSEAFSLKEVYSNDGPARYREWHVHGHKLLSPMVFLGIDIKKKPLPWKEGLQVQGILVNGLTLMKSKQLGDHCEKSPHSSLHDFLGFKGAIMLDSGGFKVMELYSKMKEGDQTLMSPKLSANTHIRLCQKTRPDFFVIPDLPYHPEIALENNLQRLRNNLCSLRMFSDNSLELNYPVFIPVFHPFPHPHYYRRIQRLIKRKEFSPKLQKFLERTQAIGVGGMVPYLLNRKGRGYIKTSDLIDFICWIRLAFPDKLLHVFGAGGSTIMPILFYLGVDSIDTTGWRVRAAYGKIQLQGTGDLSVHGTQAWRSRSIYEDKVACRLLEKCCCPACTKIRNGHLDIGYYETQSFHSFRLRALHNAYTYLQQAKQFRARIKEGADIGKYVEYVLQGNAWASRLFKIARKKVKRYRLSQRFGWV